MEEQLGSRQTLSVTEAATRLGISRNAAYAAIAEGVLPHLRIGRRIVVPVAAFDRWMAGALDD